MTKGKTSERYLEILGKIIKPNSMCLGVYEEFTAEYDFLDDSNLNGIRRSKLELYLARIDGVPHHGFWSRFVFPCSSYVCLEVERIQGNGDVFELLKGERHKGDLVLGFEYFYNHGNVFRNIINRDRKTEILIKGKKETQRSICFFLGEDIKKYIDDLNLGSDVTYERLLDILNSNKPWKYPYHK